MERVHGGPRARGAECTRERKFKCKYCEWAFYERSKCQRHEKIHEEKGKVRQKGVTKKPKPSSSHKFKCHICPSTFGWAKTWSDHLWNEHDKKEIICPGPECGKIFDNLVEFQNHWKSCHRIGADGQTHVCPFCGKEFGTRKLLRAHQKNEHKKKREEDNCSCSTCGRKFKWQYSLQRHVKLIHEKQFPVTCPLCSRGFEAKREMHRHLLRKHRDDPVTKKLQEETGLFLRKCSEVGCTATFMKQVDEDGHMKRIHGGESNEKRYKCKYCARGFWDGNKCRRHERIHEGKVRDVNRDKTGMGVPGRRAAKGNYKFKCDECSVSFRWARNWSDHLWNKHDKREISCPGMECGKVFDNLDEFRKHWKSSHLGCAADGEKHLCSFCGKEFGTMNRLRIHQRNQHLTKADEKFICEICGVEKTSSTNLYQHKRNVHRKDKTKVARKSDKQLSSSLKTEKPFICGICGKRYISQGSLWLHKSKFHRIGRSGQPINGKGRKGESLSMSLCPFCGKEFSKKVYLDNHVRFVHEKQFKLSCHVCGLKFVGRGQMNMHILVKHGEDPVARKLRDEEGLSVWKCELVGCVKRFLKKTILDRHVEKFHQGGGGGAEGKVEIEKRFKCKYCGKGFWEGYKVRRHERIHEGKGREDWKCELCGKGFSTKDYLYYHLRLTHKQTKKFQKNDTE